MSINFDTYVHEGPQPNYTPYHVWKCYSILERQGPKGRRTLASLIGLGEGSVRTMLDRMVQEGCVELTKRGASLTQRGRDKFAGFGVNLIDIGMMEESIGRFNCAIQVMGRAGRIGTGAEQRDDAVRAGAESAIILVGRNGKIVFPDDDRYPDQGAMHTVREAFVVQDGDVIIIGGASSYEKAEKGAVSAALALAEDRDRCWSEGGKLFSRDYEEEDIKCIALTIHELVGRLPVTMRSKNHYGVRCEDGIIIETNFTGPVLEETLKKGKILRRMSKAGKYRGCPVLAVPLIRDREVIAVVGVFDTTKGSYHEWLGRVRR
ncbi:MAG: DUF2111 domain-containing protein [Methanomassiliicoccales archaeon]|nr:DUF2111 domain-containing protein [Methanomassiliicoccales archaeon]MDD1755525.1 DUF2111 domain-containing protein [Methanomassiliicoccales archaeon]